MTANPTLVGPVSPTPAIVYEPRIWRGRVWTKDTGIAGVGFVFKAPYGQAVAVASTLARACARSQITRYEYGPVSPTGFKHLDRKSLRRPEDVLADLSAALHVDWAA